MLFHTPTFVAFFLIFLPIYLWSRRRSWHTTVILIGSQIFYGWWDWRFLILLWITIVVDYTVARSIEGSDARLRRRLLLSLTIASNLLLLVFFKYWNFLIELVGLTTQTRSVQALRIAGLVLPVGISFYTFQSMSYVIDVYRRQHPAIRNLGDYASFVCYFPHMVAGPIQRIHQLLPNILRPQPFTFERTASGLVLFAYGFYCKAIGDTLAGLHDPVFARLSDADPSSVTVAVLSFGVQIYVDFLGYTEMARGVSRILGIELMRNFRAPYTALSFQEFWRRWHISLSSWLRDYLYISLGGSRVRRWLRYRNLLVTMLLGGLWHGAGLNFLVWGGLHGLYLVLNSALSGHLCAFRTRYPSLQPLTTVIGWTVTIVGVMYAWLYFRVPSFDQAVIGNQKILASLQGFTLPAPRWDVLALVASVLAYDVVRRSAEDSIPRFFPSPARSVAFGAAAGCLVAIGLLLIVGRPAQQFIYFQF